MDKFNQLVGSDDTATMTPVPIVALRMQDSPPYPPPPTRFKSVDEAHLQRQAQRLRESQEASEAMSRGVDDIRGDGNTAAQRAKGLWGVLSNSVKKGFVEVQSATSSTTRGAVQHQDLRRFLGLFQYIADQGAEFISMHECRVVHQGVPVGMSVFVTSTHLCFIGNGAKDAIPLNNIVSVIPAVALPTPDFMPFIMPLPRDDLVPTAIEFYVKLHTPAGTAGEYMKYQLFDFHSSTVRSIAESNAIKADVTFRPCVRFLADTDRAWRARVQVPVDGIDYKSRSGDDDVPPPPTK